MIRGKKLTSLHMVDQFKKNWKDWRWYYFQFTNHILSKFYSFKKNNGIYIWKEKWDNLIILDACRFDVFEERFRASNVKGKLERRISRGSSTVEFLKENFEGREFPDIVYVTANPYVHTVLDEAFFRTIDLWKDCWDEEKGTVPPKDVMKKALWAHRRYPHKRIIVHFMQPHSPFIGSHRKEGNFWQLALREGKREAMKAYKSNLELVFPYVENLLNEFEGRTVVTSDHGEACGESATLLRIPIYGHPNGARIPVLIEVPWLIVSRKEGTRQEKRRIKEALSKLRED